MKSFIIKHKTKFTIAIAVVLLSILLSSVNISETVEVMSQFDWRWMGIGAIIIIISFLLNTLRWQFLLSGHNHSIGFMSLLKFRIVGAMYTDILPSGFGGDMMRVYYLSRHESVAMSESFSTAIVEKISNMVSVFLFLFIAIIINAVTVAQADMWHWIVVAASVFVLGVVVLYSKKFKRLVLQPVFARNKKWVKFVERYYNAIHVYRNHIWLLIGSIAVSIVITGMTIVLNQIVLFGLHIPLSIVDVALVVSVVALSNVVPVSFGNLGYRESLYIYMLQFYGVAAAPALAYALMMRLIRLLTSLVGLFVLVFEGGDLLLNKKQAAKNE